MGTKYCHYVGGADLYPTKTTRERIESEEKKNYFKEWGVQPAATNRGEAV